MAARHDGWIIEHRFGLNDKEVATLGEPADGLAVSPERVRQVRMGALKRLHSMLNSQGIVKESLIQAAARRG